jgi:hypothetical protein
MGKIYTFDIGTRLRTTLGVNLAGYDTIEYKINKPSGSVLTKTCSVEDAANGIVYYDTVVLKWKSIRIGNSVFCGLRFI